MKSFNRIRRLSEAVNDFVKDYKLNNITIADIGADHGYLSEILARNDKISKVIATDISKKCLNKVEELIKNNNLTKIETSLGDGLNAVEVVDLAVMAGIGGYEIINIISNQNITINGDKKSRYFVFMPSKNTLELRVWLYENNVKIIKDYIVESAKRFYSIIIVDLNSKNDSEKTNFNLYFGKDNDENNEEFLNYLAFQIELMSFFDSPEIDKDNLDKNTMQKYEIYCMANKILKEKRGE